MYRSRLKRDLAAWVERGLLDEPTAERLLADHDLRGGSFSLSAVLGVLAACLFAASILMLVAANWEAIPRLMRVIGIFTLIWIFNLCAWQAQRRQARTVAAGLLILGAASFGAGIALVGQMYHLSGDGFTALFLWMLVTMGSALLFGSAALSGMAALLAIAAFWTGVESLGGSPASQGGWGFWAPIAAIALGGLSVVTQAGRVKHLAWLLGLQWVWWYWLLDGDPWPAAGVACLAVVVFLALTLPRTPLAALRERFGPSITFYPLLTAFSALGALHVIAWDSTATSGVAVGALVLAIAAVVLDGRNNTAVRYLAYAAFAAEVLYLSYEAFDSILGSSAFFLLAGVVVAAVAFVVMRLEKRFGTTEKGGLP